MTANARWKDATKEQIAERNADILRRIDEGESLSRIAALHMLSTTGVSRVRDMDIERKTRREKNDFLSVTFASVRVRNCLNNRCLNSLEALIDFACPNGVWDRGVFLNKPSKRSKIPNFGKGSYKEMMESLNEIRDLESVSMLRAVEFYNQPAVLTTEEKERALYERLKKKYA